MSKASANVDANTLPAAQVDPNVLQEVDAYELSQVVGIFSRGSWRAAKVVKVGKVSLTVQYTTQGAIRDADDLYERDRTVDADAQAREAVKMAGNNWDYYAREVGPSPRYLDHSAGQLETMRAAVAMGRDAFLAAADADARQRVLNRHNRAADLGRTGYRGNANITTKTVKLEHVGGLVPNARLGEVFAGQEVK